MICLSRSVRFVWAIQLARACNAELATVSILGRSSCLHLICHHCYGNFTKVVQRVPITIAFSGTALSRSAVAGMLASVTVHTGNAGGRLDGHQ